MRSVPQGHQLNLSFPASLSVRWRRQQSAGSSGLQMRSTRACKRTRANAKSCRREGRTRSSDGGCLPGEQLCWKRPQQAERDFSYILTIRLHDLKSPFQTKCFCDKPAVWPGSKQGQQRSGLYKPQHSQQTEGSAWCLRDHIWILSVQFWAHQYRNDADKPKFRRRPPRCLGAGEFVP